MWQHYSIHTCDVVVLQTAAAAAAASLRAQHRPGWWCPLMSGFITYRGRCCRRGDFNHAIMHGTLSLSLQFKRAQGTVGSLGPLGVLVLPSQRCARNDRPRVAMMPMIGTAHERTILSTVFSIYVYAYVCASVACFWGPHRTQKKGSLAVQQPECVQTDRFGS